MNLPCCNIMVVSLVVLLIEARNAIRKLLVKALNTPGRLLSAIIGDLLSTKREQNASLEALFKNQRMGKQFCQLRVSDLVVKRQGAI